MTANPDSYGDILHEELVPFGLRGSASEHNHTVPRVIFKSVCLGGVTCMSRIYRQGGNLSEQ